MSGVSDEADCRRAAALITRTAVWSPEVMQEQDRGSNLKRGVTLAGCRLMTKLGAGAASEVWLGQQLKTGELFALKHVRRPANQDARQISQVENEHEVASKFAHPAFRRSIRLEREREFFRTVAITEVLEFVDGVPLDQAQLSRRDILLALATAARALDSMHEAGYAHADLKPGNLLVEDLADGRRLRIIDLGQACLLGTRKERIQGTPAFMAPEQVQRGPILRQTDIYNLAATAKALFLGSLERAADVRDDISSLTCAGLPTSLTPILARCLHAAPESRPAHMRTVAQEFEVAALGLQSMHDEGRVNAA